MANTNTDLTTLQAKTAAAHLRRSLGASRKHVCEADLQDSDYYQEAVR